ncbi:recombinase family protein [Clostridium sp.]|uniref:recombinase family protein n=1 Tax=Clostridium sp. TaxID=1506 RepID=UPI00291509DC|nr:recombinase family protein [Clostridium sp.]MDU7214547.1 recombinase family protein [Clostridium sp.]
MNTIAIYTRKSKFTGKGESIENQIEKCKKFIEFKFNIDSENVNIFIDEGFSGKNENRPQYQLMMEKIKKKEIDSIVIYQLNRLGRNARDIHNTMQLCDDLGVIIYSATEGFDSSTSFGRAVIGILASLAQLEREQLAERVKDNMYTLAKMGRWLGGQSPLGFDGSREYYIDETGKERSITKLKKNEEELKLVKLLYDKYLEEKSLSQVGKWALINHLTGKNGGNLNKNAINVILQNPVYVKSSKEVFEYLSNEGYEVCGEPNGNGLLRYGKDDEPIVATAKHKGVIPSDQWIEVQKILKDNAYKAPRMGKTNTALLTGLLRCKCGSTMRISYGQKRKDGTKPFYYICNMKINSGGTRCNLKNLNGNLFEKNFIQFLKNYSKETLFTELQKLLNNSKDLESTISSNKIDVEIEKSNKAIKQILNKLKLTDDDELSKILLQEIKVENNKLKALSKQKEELLNDQSEVVITQSEVLAILDDLDNFQKTFDDLNLEDKQKALKSLIESITLTDDKFIVDFNIKKKLDNAINKLSSLFAKYKSSQLRHPCRSYMYRHPSWP